MPGGCGLAHGPGIGSILDDKICKKEFDKIVYLVDKKVKELKMKTSEAIPQTPLKN